MGTHPTTARSSPSWPTLSIRWTAVPHGSATPTAGTSTWTSCLKRCGCCAVNPWDRFLPALRVYSQLRDAFTCMSGPGSHRPRCKSRHSAKVSAFFAGAKGEITSPNVDCCLFSFRPVALTVHTVVVAVTILRVPQETLKAVRVTQTHQVVQCTSSVNHSDRRGGLHGHSTGPCRVLVGAGTSTSDMTMLFCS
jgi:hypothetical protein